MISPIRFKRVLAAAAAAVILTAAVPATARETGMSGPSGPPKLGFQVTPEPAPLPLKGKATLELLIQVPGGYHIFTGDALSVSLQSGDSAVKAGTPLYPKGIVEDGNHIARGRVTVRIPLSLSAAKAHVFTGSLVVHWQACEDTGDKVCFLPTSDKVPFSVPVGASLQGKAETSSSSGTGVVPLPPPPAGSESTVPAAQGKEGGKFHELGRFTGFKSPKAFSKWFGAALKGKSESGGWQSRFARAAKDDLPLALLLAFLFGILSSLTPCVYPIIPVTVAYIGSRSEGQRKTHGFVLSLAYVLGLALVYAILGAVSARVGAAFGSLTQNLWVVLFIAALFFVLSLSMFNLFEIRLPSAFTSRVEQTKQKGHGKGLGGAFLIGALSGLVVSPCIGPLILAILVVVASTHSVLLGFTYLFVFALGLGILFLVIGTFSGVLASLPKSGGWMDGIRVIFGALILMAAFYFAGLYLPRTAYWIASGLALTFVVLFLLFGARKHFFSKPIRALGILLCALAFLGALPFLPPAGGTSGGASPEGWQTSLPKAVSIARREGKPLLLDFRADWCAACLDLEKKTWTDPGAQKDLDKVVPVRMDMTVNSAANRAILNRFGVKGLPTVILLEPIPPRSR